jgi:hypothetical protein
LGSSFFSHLQLKKFLIFSRILFIFKPPFSNELA